MPVWRLSRKVAGLLALSSLAGVIISHVIVLFEYIEEANERGESLRRAVIDAALVRLRPVLVTVLATLDLGPLNRAREQYNRWYLLEKECAMRSTRSATGGFETIPSATVADLSAAFPPLPVFSLR